MHIICDLTELLSEECYLPVIYLSMSGDDFVNIGNVNMDVISDWRTLKFTIPEFLI